MIGHTIADSANHIYNEQLLKSVRRLRFPSIVEREFQESFYNPRAHAFITRWGLIQGTFILLSYCAADLFGFQSHLFAIELLRVLSIIPLIVLFVIRRNPWVYRHIRDIFSAYLFLLSIDVLAIIKISADTEFAHRGYMLSLPMLIMTVFLAKPRMRVATTVSVGFIAIFNIVELVSPFRPLGFSEPISLLHIDMVMVTSLIISALTGYVLEVAERREFLQRKVIDQDKEFILLQQFELSDAVDQLTEVNSQLAVQNERLDLVNKEKNDFLAIAAHDLKNPLAGISLNISGIRRYYEKMSKDEILQAMDRIDSAAVKMRSLVVQLLDINKLESGKLQVHVEQVNIHDYLVRLQHDYGERATQKGIAVLVDSPVHLVCSTDPSLLTQVMDNLLSNALKFSPPDRRIYLRASEHNTNGLCGVRIDVEDQGPGISEEEVQQLFLRYTKLSARPTGGEHSSGLGLSIVKKMVETLGGSVSCASQLGHGATFSVLLPERCSLHHRSQKVEGTGEVIHNGKTLPTFQMSPKHQTR